MHARARPAPIASENIPQMVHPVRGEEDSCTFGLHLYIHTYKRIPIRAMNARSVVYEVSRIKHVSRYLDSA